jgi:hypothetical protein
VQCHGEYGDLAGWVVPVAKMLASGLATKDEGDDVAIIQNFYSKSCAPSNNPDEGEICTACDGTVRFLSPFVVLHAVIPAHLPGKGMKPPT